MNIENRRISGVLVLEADPGHIVRTFGRRAAAAQP
jgi:hypothetical protein